MTIHSLINKHLIIFGVGTLLLLSGLVPGYAQGSWGASFIFDNYRPNRQWISRFSASADVIATGSIGAAINTCDDVVGINRYCVVEIYNTASGLPLEITRSKTKLIGVPNMSALHSAENDIFIYIGDNIQKVIIEGLNLQGHIVGEAEIYGIIAGGKRIRNILIKNNKIHGFDSNSNAHGIAIYGTGKTNRESIRNIIIEENEVFSMRTGSSESIVINGNVRNWEIIKNVVYDVNNIAIDAIGGEGTSPARKDSNNRILPGRLDAARFGFIENNLIENMSTRDNPAYDNEESWAAAIYIDGGHHIKVKNNVAVNTPWGYEIGAENCLTTRHITLVNNIAEKSHFGDLVVGSYAKKGFREDTNINCNPNDSADANEGHGYVSYLTIKTNQFNSLIETPVEVQYRTRHAIIAEPNVTPENENGDGRASGDENAIRIEE